MDFERAVSNAIEKSIMHNNGIEGQLKDVILYHGSRGGIDGEIAPISRLRCDFGRGFYLGDNEMQAKGLVSEDAVPYLYTIKLHLSEMDPQKVLILKDQEWLNAVLAFRKVEKTYSELDVAKRITEKVSHYDVVIGAIADDRMNEAVNAFAGRSLTDIGLYHCLKYIDFGNQYVLKSKDACRFAEIISEKKLMGQELEHVRVFSQHERAKAKNVVSEMIDKYQRQGKYINEIIAEEISRGKNDVR